jgi:hypothetical protein
MTSTSPITPPPELVEEWANDSVPINANAIGRDWERAFATRAAQWGADQELEACCEWLRQIDEIAELRLARRPKSTSLKEQALAVLTQYMTGETILTKDSVDTIRRALEALDD